MIWGTYFGMAAMESDVNHLTPTVSFMIRRVRLGGGLLIAKEVLKPSEND